MKNNRFLAISIVFCCLFVQQMYSQDIKAIDNSKPESKELTINGKQRVFYRWDVFAKKYPESAKGIGPRSTFKVKNIKIKCELAGSMGYVCTCGATPWKDCMVIYRDKGCDKEGGSSPEALCPTDIGKEH